MDMAMLDELITRKEARIQQLQRDLEIQRLVLEDLQNERKLLNGSARQQITMPSASAIMPAEDFFSSSERIDLEVSLPAQIRQVLRNAARPMRAAEVAKILAKVGVTTKSRHGLKAMIATTLSRKKDEYDAGERGLYEFRGDE